MNEFVFLLIRRRKVTRKQTCRSSILGSLCNVNQLRNINTFLRCIYFIHRVIWGWMVIHDGGARWLYCWRCGSPVPHV